MLDNVPIGIYSIYIYLKEMTVKRRRTNDDDDDDRHKK